MLYYKYRFCAINIYCEKSIHWCMCNAIASVTDVSPWVPLVSGDVCDGMLQCSVATLSNICNGSMKS